ncbi:MAG: hypothetical protein ACYSR4_10820 [Planctomycetota bacterium]
MSQVISYCRKLPAGRKLNRCLDDYGVTSFEKLFDRALKLHTQQFSYDPDKPVERAVLLSRVTIGADVAITSVIIQRLLQVWPDADIVIIGSTKLKGIFGGNPQIRLRELNYSRRGRLLERFESWYAVVDILAEEVPPDRRDNILIIDPDSRISQLGFSTAGPGRSPRHICQWPRWPIAGWIPPSVARASVIRMSGSAIHRGFEPIGWRRRCEGRAASISSPSISASAAIRENEWIQNLKANCFCSS